MNSLRTFIPWSKQKNVIKPLIKQAYGSILIDKNNNKLVDFTSGLMVVNLGHNNKYIQKGIEEHMNSGIGYLPSTFSTYQREKLSDRLVDISNLDNGKVFYTLGGADSNETALFMALEANSHLNRYNKKRILSFENSYHGGSTMISSIMGGDKRKKRKELYYNPNDLKIESIIPNPSLDNYGLYSLKSFESEFRKNNVNSIIIEGSSGSAGLYLYPDNFLKNLMHFDEF